MRKRSITIFVLLAMLLPMVVGVQSIWAADDPVINEFVFNHTGTDTEAFIEVFGDPSSDYSGFTVLEIEGDGSGAGTIDAVLTLGTTDGSGFWTDDEDAENGTVTLLLVEGFTGSAGSDLDTDNDGVLNATPWTRIVDDVAVDDGGSSDHTYAGTVLTPGYDGNSYTVGGASRIPNGTDTDTTADWVRNDFDGAGFTGFDGTPDFGEALNTPGAINESVPPVTIMDIQGSGLSSPFAGLVVQTSGVVTADFQATAKRGFFLQDPSGDGDPATSDGIFVYDQWISVDVGDEIVITGEVSEYYDMTEISGVWGRFSVLSEDNPLPDPVDLNDLPNESMVDGTYFWEPLEGMLASVEDAPVVAPTSPYGEFGMLAKRDAKPGSGFYPETQQILIRSLGDGEVDYNPERIVADDESLDTPIVVMPGDRVRSLMGAVDYTFGMYKLQPVSFDVKTHNLPNLPASTRSGPNGDTVITTFNVENLFDLVDNPDKEDEGSTPSPEALETQLTKLALAIEVELELPEILIVQEVENTTILQELGDLVNDATGTDYHAVSFETSDARGIEVGFLWDANRVMLLDAYQLSGPDIEAAFGPSSASPGREPLYGEFDIGGKVVHIVGNHFKSKSGDDALFGLPWPPERITEVQRKLQAQAVRDFVDMIFDADPEALVLVAGDLNDFQFGEPGEGDDHPVAILEGIAGEVPLTNLVNLEKDDERFTYLYDGNSQVLDHMLVSPALYDLFAAVDVLHFNASYPDGLGHDPTTPLKASDHDPLEGRFNLW
jgi:predicted extracellular nuclease